MGVAALLAIVLAPTAARAQVEGETTTDASLRVYADNDRVSVWSPSGRASVVLPADVVVDVSTTIDVVSAASVDVVTSASPYAFSDRRVEGVVGVGVGFAPHQRATARVRGSDENDFTAFDLGVGWRAELAERNLTAEVNYTLERDQVGRAGDPTFARARHQHRLAVSLTQILDRRTYLDLVVEGFDRRGYLANPYRFVPIELAGGEAYVVPERVPDHQTGLAGLVRLRHAVGDHWFGHADYRLTRDTWDVTSHTVSAGASRSLADDRVQLGVELRGYRQGAASFHRAVYVDDGGAPAWRTRDQTLGRMRSYTIGAVADVALPWHQLHLTASAAWVGFRWLDDPRQTGRDALIASLAFHLPF